ncbi:hypothetical protein BDP55DRAFT_627226 [Colletotrichum godetiae]|uniref:Uncharacterized protein n=1 Tax=Colletotrichum godetiae TaxID=1209918 RepID=A0AAJ0EXY6_9PEZI|nr:uncharacterized protein BDP55DRAFT_627226 [Colletotrichum godetiae]KAK1691584.1 hypothetical protein BDP55DRAFT_627226 [Colletotrichum godetiae]
MQKLLWVGSLSAASCPEAVPSLRHPILLDKCQRPKADRDRPGTSLSRFASFTEATAAVSGEPTEQDRIAYHSKNAVVVCHDVRGPRAHAATSPWLYLATIYPFWASLDPVPGAR